MGALLIVSVWKIWKIKSYQNISLALNSNKMWFVWSSRIRYLKTKNWNCHKFHSLKLFYSKTKTKFASTPLRFFAEYPLCNHFWLIFRSDHYLVVLSSSRPGSSEIAIMVLAVLRGCLLWSMRMVWLCARPAAASCYEIALPEPSVRRGLG